MKLPRWLLIGLWTSIVLAVIGAAGWWWVTWPERTLNEFRVAAEAGRDNDWKGLSGPEFVAELVAFLERNARWEPSAPWHVGDTKPIPRSQTDFLIGRQEFEMIGAHHMIWRYVVERGHVVDLRVHEGMDEWISIREN